MRALLRSMAKPLVVVLLILADVALATGDARAATGSLAVARIGVTRRTDREGGA